MFKKEDVLQLTWNPQLLNPNGIFNSNIMVDISITGLLAFHSRYIPLPIPLLTTTNDGAENITILNTPDFCALSPYNSICPFHISVSTSGGQSIPRGITIWSGTMFFKASNSIEQCWRWYVFDNEVVTRLTSLPPCPPNQLVASFDHKQYILEDFTSLITSDTGYHKMFMNYFHPGVSACYRQTRYLSHFSFYFIFYYSFKKDTGNTYLLY